MGCGRNTVNAKKNKKKKSPANVCMKVYCIKSTLQINK